MSSTLETPSPGTIETGSVPTHKAWPLSQVLPDLVVIDAKIAQNKTMQHYRVKKTKSNFLSSKILYAYYTLMISSSTLFTKPSLLWKYWRSHKKKRLSTSKSGDLGDWVSVPQSFSPCCCNNLGIKFSNGCRRSVLLNHYIQIWTGPCFILDCWEDFLHVFCKDYSWLHVALPLFPQKETCQSCHRMCIRSEHRSERVWQLHIPWPRLWGLYSGSIVLILSDLTIRTWVLLN